MSPLPHGIANGRGTSRDLLFMFLMLTLGYKASAEQFGPGERLRRLREAVRLIKRMWSEDYVTFEGKYFQTREAKLFDKPAQPIPILIAAGGPQAAAFAGKEGDGIIVTSGKGAELYRDTLLPAMEKAAREAGKGPATIERLIEMKVSYDTDRSRAMEDTKEWAALALPAEDKVG